MALPTKKYLSRYSFSNGSLKIRNYQKSLQRVFEVSHVSLTKSEITVSEMYRFSFHMCVWFFFKQYNQIVDQSVCGLKGWP